MLLSTQDKINQIRNVIGVSKNIVCLTGIGVAMECGAVNFLHEDQAYRIEDKYHYSPEEIYSTGFYSAKKEKFFEFYKEEILTQPIHKSACIDAIKRLDEKGNMYACVTRNIYGLERSAGVSNVIELYGGIHENWCTKCHKIFGVTYMKNSKGVPVCDGCGATLRPGVRLFGEMIRNDVLTKAANAYIKADVLIVLGTNLYDSMVKNALRYYHGEKLILITKHQHFTDKKADIIIHEEVNKILPKIVS